MINTIFIINSKKKSEKEKYQYFYPNAKLFRSALMGTCCSNNKNRYKVRRKAFRPTTISISDIKTVYDFHKVLGKPQIFDDVAHLFLGHGHFGTVRLATPKGAKSPVLAIKSIAQEKVQKDGELFQRELEILRDLDHPNVIKFHECYQDKTSLHFVMEYCSGGDLMDRLAVQKKFTEIEAAKIMGKAFAAVNYLHERYIIHRDIKPENFLYESQDLDAEIKIIDFGLSRFAMPTQKLNSQVGTPYYIAPEVIQGEYNMKSDYWSLGVMMYVLLAGKPPFDGESPREVARAILYQDPDFSDKHWGHISKEAKSLLVSLLQKYPEDRTTAKKALQHPWIKNQQKKVTMDADEAELVLENLKKVSIRKKFKKEVLDILISHVDRQSLNKLKDAFKYFDKKGTGRISIADLKQVVKEQGLVVTNEQLDEIINKLEIDGSQTIGYSDFIMAAIDTKLYLKRELLAEVFSHFDVDNSGYIDAKDLKEAMKRVAKQVPEDEISEMLAECDTSVKGRISFEDFCKLMKLEEPAQNRRKTNSKTIPASKLTTNAEFFLGPQKSYFATR